MTAVVPFDFSAPVQARAARPNNINADQILGGGGFPVISIKGKSFAILKDNERRVITRVVDGEEEPAPSINVTVVRANPKSRVFYAKSYVEGDSEGAKPTCFSHDGIAPDGQAEAPQANKCALCPHAAWGTKLSTDGQSGKGTACTVNTRLAVIVPTDPDTVYLLRAPAASRGAFSEFVKTVDAHGKNYNEAVVRVGFDPEAPSPKLTFRPVGLVTNELLDKVQALYDDPRTLDIVGKPTLRAADAEPVAVGVKPAALAIAAQPAAPAQETRIMTQPARPAPPPVTREAAAPPPVRSNAASLMADLDVLLGGKDD